MATENSNEAWIAERLSQEIVEFESIPEGTIIRWEVSIGNGNKIHYYAASFINGMWNTSVPTATPYLEPIMAHEKLMDYLRNSESLIVVELATEFVEIDF